MELANTYEARKALVIAEAKVFAAYMELDRGELEDNAVLAIIWQLGQEIRQDLEQYRVPE